MHIDKRKVIKIPTSQLLLTFEMYVCVSVCLSSLCLSVRILMLSYCGRFTMTIVPYLRVSICSIDF